MKKKFILYTLIISLLSATEYQNSYVCGIFPSVLTTYQTLNVNGTHPKVCGDSEVSAKNYNSNSNLKCSASIDKCSNGLVKCARIDPPKNRLRYEVYRSDKITDVPNDGNFTANNYKDNNYHSSVNLEFHATDTYSNNANKKYMLLGAYTFDANNINLKFYPGDYYFDSLMFNGNNITITLPENGEVRIFIKYDLNFNKNNVHINENGESGNLFIYVGGNVNFNGNGGGTGLKVNGFIYSKGDINFNNNSNNFEIKGGVTAEGNINLQSNNAKFISSNDADKLGYGKCPICYERPVVNGASFNFGQCPGFSMGFNSKIEIPIKSDRTLQNVSIDEAHKKSLFNFNFLSTNEVRDQDGNWVRDAEESNDGLINVSGLGIDASLYSDKVITYTLGDNDGNYSSDDNHYQEMYSSSLFNFDFCKWYDSSIFVAHYNDNNKHYTIVMEQCKHLGGSGSNLPYGAFDTEENGRTDRNITTKIVNEPFTIKIIPIKDEIEKGKKHWGGYYHHIKVKYALVNLINKNPITEYREFLLDTILSSNVIYTNYTIPIAYRDVAMQFKMCSDYNGEKYILYPYSKCNRECNSSDEQSKCIRKLYASDDFAIRPYAFVSFGKNEYKRAGEDFNISVKAVDRINYNKVGNIAFQNMNASFVQSVIGFNNFFDNLEIDSNYYQPTSSEIQQMKNDTGEDIVAYCPSSGEFRSSGGNFNNGDINVTLSFSETGILSLKIREKAGKEWAIVDSDDTSDEERYIKESNNTYNIDDISSNILEFFIPYYIKTTGEYNTTIGYNWLYMDDINDSNQNFTTPEMAAFIKYNIKAYNKQNKIVKNFTKTCFPDTTESAPQVGGFKLNTTFDLFLDADLNVTRDSNLSFYTEDNNNNPIYVPLKESYLTQGEHHIQEWISPLNFENGESSVKVYFNIKKNIAIPQKETDIILNDINTSTSWMHNPGATNIFEGEKIDKTISFKYGSIKLYTRATI